jgi:hypothetical protein
MPSSHLYYMQEHNFAPSTLIGNSRAGQKAPAGAASALVVIGGVPPLCDSAQRGRRPNAAALTDAASAGAAEGGDPATAAAWARREAVALEQAARAGTKAVQQQPGAAASLAYAVEYRERNAMPVPAAETLAWDPALRAAANSPESSGSPSPPVQRALYLARTIDGAGAGAGGRSASRRVRSPRRRSIGEPVTAAQEPTP